MKSYEGMDREQLITLLSLQGRIINSLTRELKLSKSNLRKRKTPEHCAALRKSRMERMTPERRKEIARMGAVAVNLKKQQRELTPV